MKHKDHIQTVVEYSTQILFDEMEETTKNLTKIVDTCTSFKDRMDTLISKNKINSEYVTELKKDLYKFLDENTKK